MMPLAYLLPVVTLLGVVLNALLLLRVLRTLARLDQAADGTAQHRRQVRHAYAAWLLGQMRPHRTSTPPVNAAPSTVIDLGEGASWPRR